MATHIVNFPDAHVQSTKITATASVGIGTSSVDAYPLTIFKETEPEIRIHEGATSSSAARLYSNNSNLYIQTGTDFTSGSSGDIAFQTMGGQSTHMIVKSDGKVGVGTGSPDSALSVTGDRNTSAPSAAGIHMGMAGTNLTQYASLQMNATDRAQIDFSSPGTDADGRITYNITNGDMYFKTNGTDNRMIIDSSGNVGIGTGSPKEILDVRGAIVAPVVSWSSSQDAPYLIAATTNYDGTSTNWGTYGFHHRIKSDSGGGPRITIDTPLSGEVFCVTDTGKVGIGKTNPSVALDVNGAIKTSTTSTNIVTGSGSDVTINSTTPTTFASVTITTRGNKVLVICSGDLQGSNGTSDWLNMKFYRGTTAIGKNHRYHMGTSASTNQVFAMHVIDEPSAGTYTYYAKGYRGNGDTFFGEDDNPQITAIEFL